MKYTLTTAPLSAVYFGTVSLVSPLSNLLVLWMAPALFASEGVPAVLVHNCRHGLSRHPGAVEASAVHQHSPIPGVEQQGRALAYVHGCGRPWTG